MISSYFTNDLSYSVQPISMIIFETYVFFIPLGTWPVGTYLEAELQL
jgi:hypothetical protein